MTSIRGDKVEQISTRDRWYMQLKEMTRYYYEHKTHKAGHVEMGFHPLRNQAQKKHHFLSFVINHSRVIIFLKQGLVSVDLKSLAIGSLASDR